MGFSHYDRQLRNDLLVLASMIATKCQETPFIETGFAKQLTLFATFQEGNTTRGREMNDIGIIYYCESEYAIN